jgi:hypothetical protein
MPMEQPRELSIVVLGAMNPAIHHPSWYQSLGILSSDETHDALSHNLICTPELCQFTTSTFQISCIRNRWEVKTADSKEYERIVELSVKTFNHLSETPINAYGFNHNYDVEPTLDSVGTYLAKLLFECGLRLDSFERASATIAYTLPSDKCIYNLSVSPSRRGPNYAEILHNTHYEIQFNDAEFKRFDLEPLLRDGAKESKLNASKHLIQTLNLLKSIKK